MNRHFWKKLHTLEKNVVSFEYYVSLRFNHVYLHSLVENHCMTPENIVGTAPSLPLANLCVLIVEDMPDELRMLASFLSEAGARVLMAVEGLDALRLARLMRPDVILLDVQLPPPNGFAVCSSLRDLPETTDIPVLFISGLLDVSTKLQAFSAGARDFICKPFTAAELLARVALHAGLGSRLRGDQPDASMPRWLSTTLQRLHSALARPPELELLAQEAGTSVHRLHDAFRTHLHTTPAAYVREIRLKEAARQLRETATPVAEVGIALGFQNPASFATMFRERFGVAPRQYRQGQAPSVARLPGLDP